MQQDEIVIELKLDHSKFPVIVERQEYDALREAVEVLETLNDRAARDLESEKNYGKTTQGFWFRLARRFDEFREATYEAVEVLEDQLEHERESSEGFKQAAASYYAQTLDLKEQVRELADWYGDMVRQKNDEREAHSRTRAALRDAETKIAELHKRLAKWEPRYVVTKDGDFYGVLDNKTNMFAPFGGSDTFSAEICADFNAGKGAPSAFMWRPANS